MRHPSRRLGVLLAAAGVAAACAHTTPAQPAPSTPPAPPVHVTVPSLAGATQPWQTPLTVTVSDGTLRDVVVDGPVGRVAGSVSGAQWTSRGPLWPATRYTVPVAARDRAAHPAEQRLTVTTSDAPRLNATLTPGDGDTVGVGMPVRVQFNRPVPAAAQAAVAHRLSVTSTPAETGGWRWLTPQELHWRPSQFWPAHARVHVSMDLTGLHLAPNLWGGRLRTTDWTVGDALVSTVDISRHTMTVTRNGSVLKVLPMSAGRDAFPTHAGVHIALEKEADITMDSATVGIPRNSPNGYYERGRRNGRIAYSGEFVHSAPWSVGSQGSSNVSHGCVNLSPANAQWFFNLARRGDVVRVVNGGARPDLNDPGTFDWNTPGSGWQH